MRRVDPVRNSADKDSVEYLHLASAIRFEASVDACIRFLRAILVAHIE